MISLFDLLVIAAILGFAYWGWLEGLERASVAGLEVLGCLTLAVTFHETLAGYLHGGAVLLVGEWASQAWSILLGFSVLAWGLLAAIRFKLHHPAAGEFDDEPRIDPLGDRIGGAIAGSVGGALFVGGLLVTLSMVPFLAGLKPGDSFLLDVGKIALRTAGGFAGGWEDGRSLPLWGEPPSRASEASALLTSEPWFDADEDGTLTESDRYRDVDGNGTFTRNLYFEDLDRDGLRRIGLIDKYIAGRWDSELFSEDRPRPKPPAPPARPSATPPRPRPGRPDAPKDSGASPKSPAAGTEAEKSGLSEPVSERLPGDDF